MDREINVVLLDFGGTLDGDGVHWSTQYHRAFAAAGFEVPRKRLDQAFFASDRVLLAARNVDDPSLESYVLRQVREMLTLLGEPGLDAAGAITDRFIEQSIACIGRGKAALRRHRPRVRFGLVSNFTADLPRILDKAGIGDLFDCTVVSRTEGVSKPDHAIFQLALDRLGARPRETAMIGDSLTSDIMPAKALGLTTVWIKGDEIFGKGEPSAADHVAASLPEALELVCGRVP